MQEIVRNGETYIKFKYKTIEDIVPGDFLRFTKDNEFYDLKFFYTDGVNKVKKKCYFYFDSFIAHGDSLKRLFELENRNNKNYFIVYKKAITNKKEENHQEKVFSIFENVIHN